MSGRYIAGVEVKAAASTKPTDYRSVRKRRDAAGSRFATGVVLYDGTTTASFEGGPYAVPIRRIWAG